MMPSYPPTRCSFCRRSLLLVRMCSTCGIARHMSHQCVGYTRGVTCMYVCRACEDIATNTRRMTRYDLNSVSSTT